MLLKVTQVEHYTDTLFKFRTERPRTFRFSAGEFVMIGLDNWSEKLQKNKPIMRAYSISSGPYDDWLEFYSIKVPDGPLTSKLQKINVGDEVEVGQKPTGTLTHSNLELGGDLWLLATGTGIAPFISLLRDPATYELFDYIRVLWSVREQAELLAYDEFLRDLDIEYLPIVTQDPEWPFERKRITTLMEEGLLIATFAFVLIVLMVYLFAFLKNKNTHYMVNGYRFGQGQFSTLLETQKFVKILLKTLGLAVLILMSIAILTVFMMVLAGSFPSLLNIFSQDAGDILEWLLRHNIEGALGLVYIAFLMATFILVAYFQSQVRQYVFANTVLNGKVNFSSSLTTISLAWLMMSNFLLVLVTLGLGTPWAKVRRAKLILKNTLVDVEHGIDGFITQQQDKQSALGEQIGDAFDVDIGIGV